MSQLPIPVSVTRANGGAHKVYRFANGYGVSAIDWWGAYADRGRTVEAAVIRWTGDDVDAWELDQTTPITDDVLGWQTMEDVRQLCARVRRLPRS